jgi:DNA recombination protein RmuC
MRVTGYQEISENLTKVLSENNDRLEKLLKDEFGRNREESSRSAKEQREEIGNSIKLFGDQLSDRMTEISKMQKSQLDIFANQLQKLTQSNEEKFDKLKDKVGDQLKEIQDSNSKKLEEMRVVVDEKLHATLEKRLGESFKLVSDRLEMVHKGLGEMQTLATGVGDLKRVLTNVKTRGIWGEIQLGTLIDQLLTPDQYSKNVATKKGSAARVEFAIKLPGKEDSVEEVVWMPIDAKFPLDIYQKLIDAQDQANPALVEEASKEIERRIKDEAKSISTKYLDPPNTTDFAFMFLPIEGLYAEVLRITGLFDFVQREYKVTIVGPTNFAAVLNSLQMGFRTLAIEKRSSEVWKLLSVVKTEFGKFGDILEKTQTKLDQASKSIGDASKKSRTIERKLRDVHELPAGDNANLLNNAGEEEE